MDGLPSEWPIDLGDGYRAEWHGPALWVHCPKLALDQVDGVCPGAIRIPTAPDIPGAPHWVLEQKDPITLSPSIAVTGRGKNQVEHFFIRNGKVVQA